MNKKDDNNFYINIVSLDKWTGDQGISILNFTSLDATIATLSKIFGIICFIKLIKAKKHK